MFSHLVASTMIDCTFCYLFTFIFKCKICLLHVSWIASGGAPAFACANSFTHRISSVEAVSVVSVFPVTHVDRHGFQVMILGHLWTLKYHHPICACLFITYDTKQISLQFTSKRTSFYKLLLSWHHEEILPCILKYLSSFFLQLNFWPHFDVSVQREVSIQF